MNTKFAYLYDDLVDYETMVDVSQPSLLLASTTALFEQYEPISANEAPYEDLDDDDCCNLYLVPY